MRSEEGDHVVFEGVEQRGLRGIGGTGGDGRMGVGGSSGGDGRTRRAQIVAHLHRRGQEMGLEEGDFFVNGFQRHTRLDEPGHELLQRQPVKPADHHQQIQPHQAGGHGAAEMKRRVHEHQRQRQDRQPDVRAQPRLRPAHAQGRESFARVEQHRENKDCVRDDPVRQP